MMGDPFISEGGEWVKGVANFANNSTDRLREVQTKRRGRVQNTENTENFANVINRRPLNLVLLLLQILPTKPYLPFNIMQGDALLHQEPAEARQARALPRQ